VAHAEYAWEEGAARHSLWFHTNRTNGNYRLTRNQQIEREQDIEDMFCGARQSGTRDVNGYILYFIQDLA
jgi:hypothetical protein